MADENVVKSRFIQTMDSLQADARQGPLSLERIFTLMGEEGHSILIVFLCIPYMQPIPLPGLSTVFGFLISLIAWFLYLQRPPWLPRRFAKVHISSETILKVSEVAERFWSRLGRLIKTRWVIFHDLHPFRVLNTVLLVSNGILLALPLPIPLSNFLPAITILFCAVGYMEKDGLLIVLSYVWSLISFSFFTALALGASWTAKSIYWDAL